MRKTSRNLIFGAFAALTATASGLGIAQQVTGVPGSPSATMTIPGDQLPAPQIKFGGEIKPLAQNSKSFWQPRIVPPKGAPNVLLIMTDDSGFGVPSTFGGVIPTPALDRIAGNGLRYTNFHSTALCSPTRAALITGRNHHSAGFGVIAEQSTGFPGYNSIINKDKATIGRMLLDNGTTSEEAWLNSPTKGLLIESMVWREMHDFSADCVLLVLASDYYDEADYIRSYPVFLEQVKNA